jgi:hypothetical protein
MNRGSYYLEGGDVNFPYRHKSNYDYRGNQENPATIKAFDKIEASNTINFAGDVTYTAGNKVVLKPGFHAKPGSYFKATVDPSLQKFHVDRYWDDEMQHEGSVIEGINIEDAPSGISPNGDGINEELCIDVKNANQFVFKAYYEKELVYSSEGNVNGDNVCVWDGTGSDCGYPYYPYCPHQVFVQFTNDYDKKIKMYTVLALHGKTKSLHERSSSSLKKSNKTTEKENTKICNRPHELSVHPNPSNGIFNIYVTSPGNIKIQVLSMNGTSVYTNNYSDQNIISVDIRHLPKSMYLLKVITDEMTQNEKIIYQ